MGRTLKITIHSARDLRNADEDEGGHSDPYVLVCFDNKIDQELGRTPTVEDSACPVWEHEMEVDVTPHIQAAVEEGAEPQMLTFCVYDGDAGEAEALGVAGVSFKELAGKGKFEGEIPVFMGTGFVNVSVRLSKVKKSSMLTSDATLKIAGGVAGTAALGLVGAYLYNRHQKKKDKLAEAGEGEGEGEGEDQPRTGMEYGFYEDDDDDDDEDRGNVKKWWEMEDEDDEDEDDNRWGDFGNE